MKIIHWIYCLFLTACHFIYTVAYPSLINGERYLGSSDKILEPSYIHAFFLSRIKFGEFARRPLTTWLIQFLENLGFTLDMAFIVVEYSGLFIAFVLLFKLTMNILKHEKFAYASVIVFASSFWVLHALFAEIYAYDEPWQYAAIFASFIFLNEKNWIGFSVFYFLALIARESTLLLLPGIFFFLVIETPIWSRTNMIRTIKVGWTVPAYALFLYYLIQSKNLVSKSSSYMEDIRFKHLYYSFADSDIGIDTITSFALSICVAFTLLFVRKRFIRSEIDQPWIWAFVLNFGINAFITFTLTMGRETRIFAQPVLLLSPFLGLYLIHTLKIIGRPFANAFSDISSFLKWFSVLILFSLITFAISLYCYELYWPTDTKFFSGFQHNAFVTFSLCALAVLLVSLQGDDQLSTKKSLLPTVLLILPVALFFGNQSGFRAYDTFEPIKNGLEKATQSETRGNYLIVGSTMPNLAENYFNAHDIDVLAGDFNFQLPVKQFLYRKKEYLSKNLIYMELEPAINFPFTYILSEFGEIENVRIGEQSLLQVHTDRAPTIEPSTFICLNASEGFQKKTGYEDGHPIHLQEEYSLAFKHKLVDLGIDSLYSFGVKADFISDMDSEAALVVTIDVPDGEDIWEHEFLTIFLCNENDWNTAYKAIGNLSITDPKAEIAFYVWNPKKTKVEIRNLEIVLNTKWTSSKSTMSSVLASRKLK